MHNSIFNTVSQFIKYSSPTAWNIWYNCKSGHETHEFDRPALEESIILKTEKTKIISFSSLHFEKSLNKHIE
jgi:hypothetical protein